MLHKKVYAMHLFNPRHTSELRHFLYGAIERKTQNFLIKLHFALRNKI